ncbi:putative FBD-associated F-box protein At5g56690 [Lolium perenne]|uniref:putative FBD-associated F-box protein At5g56690 n=1 Tax=Lolium perenne TaxID=4522 RepID=UPI003A99D37C
MADLISALPDDLLLQVLGRLPLTAAAARTSLLSRRWRGLWTRLPNITFREVALDRLGSALASLRDAAVGPGVPFLDIAFDSAQAAAGVDDGFTRDGLQKRVLAGLPSLLHAAAGLSPVEFHLALPRRLDVGADVELPRFHRATSIHLYALNLRLTLPPSTGGFPKLETLSLSGYRVDLAALVRHCPCLRVLRVTQATLGADINIRSESLQKLFLRTNETRRWTDSINIEAPKLKRLTLLFRTDTGARLSVSLVAPLLEKVSWCCSYATKGAGLAPWGLSMARLYAAESLGQRVTTCAGEDSRSSQLSNVNVLSLKITAH